MVFVNGKEVGNGRNIVIENGKVIIDGRLIDTGDAKEISIQIAGDVASLSVDACKTLKIDGSAGSVRTASGNVHCGDVHGDVHTMSGDVHCGAVQGAVSTMSGDIVSKA